MATTTHTRRNARPGLVTPVPHTTGAPRGTRPDGLRPDAPRESRAHGAPDRHVIPTGDPGGRIEGLDGLRAIAVLAVLVYHLIPGALPGGFIGVDVFFVVSGFLITTLLLREIRRSGRVDLVGFWIRRGRRLLPALFAVLLVALPVAWLVHRDLTVDADRQVLGALTFTTNWLEIVAGSSYFDQTAPHLLKNLWSLAIEEQFYWLWPVLLVLLIRATGGLRTTGRTVAGARAAMAAAARTRTGLALGAAAVSMILMAVLVRPDVDPTRVYYGTDTHLFGLALGVALAFARSAPDGGLLAHPTWRRASVAAGPLALAALLALALTLDESSALTYRLGLQAANVATVVLLAAVLTPPPGRTAAGSGTPLLGLLRLRPLEVVGERSYGLYLWHWPVIVILAQAVPTAPGTWQRWAVLAACVVVTAAVTEASYRWIEGPVRTLGFRVCAARVRDALRAPRAATRRVASAALAGVAALALATAAVAITAPAESETAAVIHAKEAELAAQEQARIADVARLGDRTMPAGEDITAFGDSIVVTAKDGLQATFPDIMIDAKSIRRWGDGLTALRAQLDAGTVRRAVLVDFGTNAGIEREEEVREFLDLLGPERMVVVANIASTSTWVPAVNAQLDAIVADYPNAIVADWNSAISTRPALLQSDHIHPDLGGAYLYAEVVRDAFAALSHRLTRTAPELAPLPQWPVDRETGEYRRSGPGGAEPQEAPAVPPGTGGNDGRMAA